MARKTPQPELPTATFVGLGEVEEALAPDEALLSFQIALWEDIYGDFGGFLQAREISDLRLGGQLVVLSACRSASGSVLRGEGVLGLARAFFQSGARTVIGSLWPLRDDEAAVLFDRFYRHLAGGMSVAEALQRAQGEAMHAGLPAADWAGLVALGDASLRLPARTPVSPGRWWAGALAIVLAGGAVLGYLRRRRRAASH